MAALTEENSALRAELDALRSGADATEPEVERAAANRLAELEVALAEARENADAKLAAAEEQVLEAQCAAADAAARATELESELERLSTRVAAGDATRGVAAQLQAELDASRSEVLAGKGRVAELQQMLTTAEAARERLETRNAELEAAAERAGVQLDSAKQAVRDCEQQRQLDRARDAKTIKQLSRDLQRREAGAEQRPPPVRAQAQGARRQTFLEQHTAELTRELQRKSRVIQGLLLRYKVGNAVAEAAANEAVDPRRADPKLQAEVIARLQQVTEDTIIENVELKCAMDVLTRGE